MDGVPVKISEKFRPPRKVTLPVGFMNRLEATLENTLQDVINLFYVHDDLKFNYFLY